MSKLTKNQKSVADKVEVGKAYSLMEASCRTCQGDYYDKV